MDLGWNYASESQAYDRVHRLGQEKEVFVKRLVVRNTIEERSASKYASNWNIPNIFFSKLRMLKLQETKVGSYRALLCSCISEYINTLYFNASPCRSSRSGSW